VGVGLGVGNFVVERRIVVESRIREDLDDVQRLARRRIVARAERRGGVKNQIAGRVEAVERIAGDRDDDLRDVGLIGRHRRAHVKHIDGRAGIEL